MKKIIFKEDARKKLAEGVQVMYDAVATTYSPKGRNVAIGRQWGVPIVIHDGVGVAKEVEHPDEFVDLGINLIREAATRQVSEAGDGTTVTTILAYHIVTKGLELLAKGVNPMVLRKQMEKALPALTAKINELSQPVKTKEQIHHIALISASDDEIADAVTEAVGKVGSDGLVTVEGHPGQRMEVDYTEGLELDKGWGEYPHFITNPDRMEAVVEDASILVLGRKVTLINEIAPLLEAVVATNKNIVIIGEIGGDALSMVIVNKMKGNINALVVPPPNYGDRRKDALDDLALITGATVVTDEIGLPKEQFVHQFDKRWIGSAKMVIARKQTTNIVKYEPGDFSEEDAKESIKERNSRVVERIKTLREQKEEAKSIYDKEKIQERLAKLTTGVAVIKVGAKTDIDARERLERTKDAVPAAQAAVDEGIVPGGGVVLLQIAKDLEGRKLNEGEQLLYDVLQEPIKKLLLNAGEGENNQEKILEEIKKKGGNFGYNANTENVEDLIKSGVIDPAKVIRLALENAVSVGTSILTTDCLIAIETEKADSKMVMA